MCDTFMCTSIVYCSVLCCVMLLHVICLAFKILSSTCMLIVEVIVPRIVIAPRGDYCISDLL